MDCTLGRDGTLEVSNDGVTWTKIGAVVDGNYSLTVETVDCTNHDSNGIRQIHPSMRSLAIDFTARYVDGDAGQGMVIFSIVSGTELWFRWRNETAPNKRQTIGKAVFTSQGQNMPTEDTVEFSAACEINNFTITYQP